MCPSDYDTAQSPLPYPPASSHLPACVLTSPAPCDNVPPTYPGSGRPRKIPSPLTSDKKAFIDVVMGASPRSLVR